MLNRTNGFRALERVFGKVYLYLAGPGDYVSGRDFKKMFDRVDVESTYFTIEQFKPGTSGEAALRRFLEPKSLVDSRCGLNAVQNHVRSLERTPRLGPLL